MSVSELVNKENILVKISGDFFSTDNQSLLDDIGHLSANGVNIAIVVGGGNVIRGREKHILPSEVVDNIGICSTIINAFFLHGRLKERGLDSIIMNAFDMRGMLPLFKIAKARKLLQQRKIIIFSGGLGIHFFSTDVAAVVRACQMGCNIVFKATKIEGIYEDFPLNKVFVPKISYDQYIDKRMKIMDMPAVYICQERSVSVRFFSMYEKKSLYMAWKGEGKFSTLG